MDFELLSDTPSTPSSLFENFERLLTNRRRQLQLWQEKIPYQLSFFIFFAVAFELAVSHHLLRNSGAGMELLASFSATAVVLFILEWIVVSVAHYVAEFFDKKGSRKATLATLNFGLTPLLLILPVTLLCSVTGKADGLRFFLLVFLISKVWINWRESIEFSTKLSRFQSTIAMGAVTGIAFMTALLVFYVTLINQFATLLFNLN
jgi:hypothetical protein